MTTSPFPPSPFPPSPFPPAATPAAANTGSQPGALAEIVRIANEKGYSDVHLGVGEEPRYRARGEIAGTGWPITDAATFNGWMREMLSPAEIDAFQRDKEFDGSHAFPFVRVRINLLDSLRGPAMVLRLIPQTIASLEDLNLPPVLKELAARPKGMVLVTGPTGSGKSTTLAAMIDWINRNMSRHILTIEDPVEFVHESRQSLIRHREVGQHTKVFQNALRAALREDPDVILIGEIRDQETLATAIEASQTGHLVFGTLHTNSAVKTVERVLGMVPPNEQDSVRRAVSESLLGVIAQGLLKTTDGKRAAFHDILINTEACKDYIQRGELDEIEEIMKRSGFDGMQTANQSLQQLVEDGRVTAEDAIAQSLKPNELAQALRGRT
ncbi:type IV pilus twitching motility protein PilT [Cyanobium sp. ATX 6E8]|uniref:type IV pilus twitching motility protein PilT n=1 Tax=Cyanobium sp. ATX 6E8 TaxID=2823701 RepID=UPI0020CCFED6|nr:type IV pilus twitching motility protein PilT [Cyanobium sp. ATX 6E8]MCP9941573.1 type IV pilus twitching motility protein PilT [Cyanobium sp. ATX 6E8]